MIRGPREGTGGSLRRSAAAGSTSPLAILWRKAPLLLPLAILACALSGCTPSARMLPANQQAPIDRSLLSYPTGFVVQPYIRNLTAPTAIAWDTDGSLLVAEGGSYSEEPRIIAFRKDGSTSTIYPQRRQLFVDIGKPHFTMYGPIGGMLVYNGLIYVSHRDADGFGMISALDRHGGHTTIVAHLPARGDYAVTDLTIDPRLHRLYFGVGAATNSGVVGIDNWEWVRELPQVHDQSFVRLHLNGYRFDSPNPFSGLFGPADIAVTAPFQPFNVSNQTEIDASKLPNAAIYSCSPSGGDLRVEATGIRYPRGLAWNRLYAVYFTNEGMELRGTRPVKNDPDALLRLIENDWYGWPDYTADLQPVENDRFQPPPEMIAHTGYNRVLFVINHNATNLEPPVESRRDDMLHGTFAPLSGAAKMDFVPNDGPFKRYAGQAVVALSGDVAPYSTSGRPIIGPIGFKV
ncbi:MAG TPA: hypothetical protein VN541_16340, partial [Tepidisphaeraceae bacterium]|nr:hypothetical protein [Tepidisphaeraceae bacterium]